MKIAFLFHFVLNFFSSKGPEKSITELKSYASLYTTEQLLTRLSKSQVQIVNKNRFFFLHFEFDVFLTKTSDEFQVDGQTEIKQTNGQISWGKNKLAQLRMRIDMLLGKGKFRLNIDVKSVLF